MNAQQLLNETPSQHFDYSKFWKSSKVNNSTSSTGDKRFVARQEIKHPALVCKKVLSPLPSHSTQSLMPRTLNYSKLNKAREDLAWQKEMKQLGIKQI